MPWGGDRWPQQTHLALDDAGTTLKIARGDSFTLSVKVRPGDRIPETARVTYNFIDGESITEPLRPTEGGEFRGRIETVESALQVLGRRRRRHGLDPRYRSQGRSPSGSQPADHPSGVAQVHGHSHPDAGRRPDLVPGAGRHAR